MKQQSQLLRTFILNLFFKETECEIKEKEKNFEFGLCFQVKPFQDNVLVRSSGFQFEVPMWH